MYSSLLSCVASILLKKAPSLTNSNSKKIRKADTINISAYESGICEFIYKTVATNTKAQLATLKIISYNFIK